VIGQIRDHHDRPEARVLEAADRQLEAGGSRLLDEEAVGGHAARPQGAGDAAHGGQHLVRIAQAEPHPADVRLVEHAGRHDLQHERPGERAQCLARALERVRVVAAALDERTARHPQSVAGQRLLGEGLGQRAAGLVAGLAEPGADPLEARRSRLGAVAHPPRHRLRSPG
jgi:hypothetical protein